MRHRLLPNEKPQVRRSPARGCGTRGLALPSVPKVIETVDPEATLTTPPLPLLMPMAFQDVPANYRTCFVSVASTAPSAPSRSSFPLPTR
jgi:hypothetical protein